MKRLRAWFTLLFAPSYDPLPYRLREQGQRLSADLKRSYVMMEMRRTLIREGDNPPLQITPRDLERFNLEPWDGNAFGMVSVESPIEIIKR